MLNTEIGYASWLAADTHDMLQSGSEAMHLCDALDLSLALVDPFHPIGRAAQYRLQGYGLDVVIGIEGFDWPGQNTFFLVPAESLTFNRIRARLRSWRKKLPSAHTVLLTANVALGHHRALRPTQSVPAFLKQALALSNMPWCLLHSDAKTEAALSNVVARL